MGSYFPFKPIFQKQLGLSSAQNGLIQGIDKIIGVITMPVGGAIADKIKSAKPLMISLMVLSACLIFSLYFIPSEANPKLYAELQCCGNTTGLVCLDSRDAEVYCDFSLSHCNKNETKMFNCKFLNKNKMHYNKTKNFTSIFCNAGTNFTFTETLDTNFSAFANISCPISAKNDYVVYGITFILAFFITVASATFLAPTATLIDATALQALGKDQVDKFGLERLWGAVGFGIFALIVGSLTHAISNHQTDGSKDNFFLVFLFTAVFLLFSAITSLELDIISPGAQNIFVGALSLFKELKIILFFVIVYVAGCAAGLVYSFLFWFVVTLPGSSQLILGFAIFADVSSEIPVLLISKTLMEKTSYEFLLSVGLFCYGIRFALYTLITEAWQVILVELMHGPSYGLLIAVLNPQAALLSPKGMVSTTIGITQCILRALGYASGALLGGIAYGNYGPIITFQGMAIICFVVSMLYLPAVKIEAYFNPGNPDENKGLL